MTKQDTYFKIDETTPKNAYLLNALKQRGISVRKLAKEINIGANFFSQALNNKNISRPVRLKIAKYFGVDSTEIFGTPKQENIEKINAIFNTEFAYFEHPKNAISEAIKIYLLDLKNKVINAL